MADTGFAIRCPHCAKWNQWPKITPKTVAVVRAEFDEILTGLHQASEAGTPWDYTHPKLMRCTAPRWACPSSFEAIVFRSWKEMKSCLQNVPEEWPFRRDFRLYRVNCIDRWEGQYWAIMFCTPPFTRMRDIEFESLMNRELLSRLIVGMSVEINSVLTIFGANIFEPEGEEARVYWMPIEGYSREKKLTPPRFNKFCDCLRNIEMRKLVEEYEAKNFSVDNCPIGFGRNGKCADKEKPACMRKPKDWCHCPAFMKERETRSLCYGSDLILIGKVAASKPEEAIEKGISHPCPAKFTEYGFPIMVHDHLVAVVMIGQVFSDPEEIAEVDEIVSKCKLLEGYEDDLKEAKQDLIKEENELRKKKTQRFFMDADEVQKRIDLLRPNIERITEMANARYRDIRRRSEAVFREELLEYFQSKKNDPKFFYRAVPHILKRMREFWAFKAVYLVAYSHTSKDIRVIAMSSTSKGEKPYGVPGKKVGKADPVYRQTHPIRYLYHRAEFQEGLDPLVKDLLRVFDEVSQKDEFSVEGVDIVDANHLFVLVPFYNEVYAFIFSVRDAKGLCRLERPARGDVSELCQEIILRICTELVYEFSDVWYREAEERAWREFSALASHRIGNEINAVGTLIDVLGGQLMADPQWARKWGDRLPIMTDSIKRAKKMLTEQATLTAEIRPKFEVANLENLVRRAAVGILPATAKLSFEGSRVQASIWVDPGLMEQAFRELFVNSVRIGGETVHITVIASGDAKNLRISFRDNGPGISTDKAERIFEPFVTSEIGRTGLGLATVRRIIEAHGGMIRVAESDVGANFIITLPVEGE